MMTVKAKYNTPFGIFYKYFHTQEEMDEWFQDNRICKLQSYEEGPQVTQQAEKYGYR